MPTRTSGIALLKLDRAEEARQNLESALKFGQTPRAAPGTPSAWPGCSSATRTRPSTAWEQCTELNPEQYDALYNIGRVSGQMKDWKKARAALEHFVATAPPKQYGKDIAEVRAVLADMKRQGL